MLQIRTLIILSVIGALVVASTVSLLGIDFYSSDDSVRRVFHGHKDEAAQIARTRWTKMPCLHCHGTGHVIVVINVGNTSYRILKPCPWCKGTGTRGTSKK